MTRVGPWGAPDALPPDMGAIQAVVCSRFGVTLLELMAHRRTPGLARARFAAFWLARAAGYSFPAIGRAFDRHHTTVMCGVSRARRMAAFDPGYAAALAEIVAPFGWDAPLTDRARMRRTRCDFFSGSDAT